MILLVNDDGIDAPGLRPLARALRETCRQPVVAIAPTRQHSGRGHAITIDRPLVVNHRLEDDFFAFTVDGTPTDCLKIGLKVILKQAPTLVVSGVNDGPNVGRSLFYSGTVGAAMEAAVEGCCALALSLDHGADRDFQAASAWGADLASRCLEAPHLRGRVINCNLPGTGKESWLAPMTVPHGLSGFDERFRQVSHEGPGTAWRLEGDRVEREDEDDTDAHALARGHITVGILAPDYNPPRKVPRNLSGIFRAPKEKR